MGGREGGRKRGREDERKCGREGERKGWRETERDLGGSKGERERAKNKEGVSE